MISPFDETPEAQLERARRKIYSGWIDDDSRISKYDQMYAEITLRTYGPFARGWIWSMAPTPARSEGSVPNGFQFNVSPRAPLYLRPFSPDALFAGTLCYPLSSGEATSLVLSSKTSISHEHFANGAIEKELRERVLDDRDLGGSGNSNYAGIFWSFENDRHEFYCVVQTHDAALSQRALQLIRDHEPESFGAVADYAKALLSRRTEGIEELADAASDELQNSSTPKVYTSWSDMFFHNEEMRKLMELQKRHRAAVVVQTLRAIGVGPVRSKVGLDENIRAILEDVNTSHNMFNFVERTRINDALSDVVYLSNLTSVLGTTTAGVVVRSSFEEGLSLIRGRAGTPQFADAEENRASFIGVPVATGPVSIKTLPQSATLPIYVYSKAVNSHPLMHPANWPPRTKPGWREWERACGIVSDRSITLKPSRVRLSLPAE